MFENLVEVLKANPRRIVYTEGTDARILESAARLKQGGFLTPILVGNVDDVKAAAKAGSFDIEGLEIIDPANYDKMDEMAQCMFDLRKGKMTMEEVRANLQKGNYFGTMLVKMGVADALLGGATYSTADTVRPALQLIKTKKGAHLVSSCFIMVRGDEMLAMGDCAINIDYQDTVDKATGEVTFSAAQKLAEVAIETAKTAETFGIDPKVAMLSFSTKGSGKGGTVALSHDATVIAKELAPELKLDGEMQFDAAVSRAVARLYLLCELCLPFVRTGGVFLAMKGPDCAAELDEARSAIRKLGGTYERTARYTIPGTDVTHSVVVIRKTAPTPPKYPRRWAKMQKEHL